ncbi:hypothetical protein CRE_21099 [Caenorhabditis remanei]|uniref:Phlebovirus glycoprotein G2 fusion domain-containing protein n=1 Tax=Caenorhabditis remanei TaxID=31234 RepID=E3NUX4_CAERE|nr:hypothetical protein CRE_21099 [Caenorhabditis remanei]
MEIFRCMEYNPVARIQIVSTSLNSYKNFAKTEEIKVQSGKVVSLKDITITVNSMQIPSSPVLNSWFLKNGNQTATWIENQMPSFQCQRSTGNCTLHEKCTCSPAETVMNCYCEDDEVDSLFQTVDRRLPVQKGIWRFETDDEKIMARTENSISTTITLKINKLWQTKVIRSADTCHATTSHAVGCYSCESGTQVDIRCSSKHAATMANVDCGEEVFTIPCTPEGTNTNITFFSDKAKFKRICVLDCGSKKTEEFEITGVL